MSYAPIAFNDAPVGAWRLFCFVAAVDDRLGVSAVGAFDVDQHC